MPLPADIEQRIAAQKAKGFTDEQIQAAIKAKYGVDYGSATPAPAPTKRGVEKVGDFLGITDFAKGLGVGGGLKRDVARAQKSRHDLITMTGKLIQQAKKYPVGDPRRERLLEAARNNNQGSLSEDDVTAGVTNRKFGAGAAATAINVIGAGSLGAKAAGPGLIGTTKYAAQPLKAAVLQSAGQAGGLAASREVGKGASAGEAAKAAIGPAAIAGGLTGLLGLAARGLTKAGRRAPERVYERALPLRRGQDTERVLHDQTRAAQLVKDASKISKADPRRAAGLLKEAERLRNQADVYGTAVREGFKGNTKNLYAQFDEAVGNVRGKVREAVAPRVPVGAEDDLFAAEVAANLPGQNARIAKAAEQATGLTVDTTKHLPLLEDFLEQTKVALKPKERAAITRALAGRINEDDALTVRILLDKYMPKGAYGLDLPNNAKTVALLDVANDLREQLSSVNPDAGRLLTEESKFIRLRDAAGALAAKETRRVPFSRIDALLGGGAAASFGFGNPLLGAGLIGIPVARAALTNPSIATRAAVGIDRGARLAERVGTNTDAIRRLIRAGIIAGSSQ